MSTTTIRISRTSAADRKSAPGFLGAIGLTQPVGTTRDQVKVTTVDDYGVVDIATIEQLAAATAATFVTTFLDDGESSVGEEASFTESPFAEESTATTTGGRPISVEGHPPTLGDVADEIRAMRAGGVTRESIEHVLARVFDEPVDESASFAEDF